MHSYTTQSHQRNYQGKVVLPTAPVQATVSQPKQHKPLGKIATTALACAIIGLGSLLGATTIHNQPVYPLRVSAQVTEINNTNNHVTTYSQQAEDLNQDDSAQEDTNAPEHPARRTPISNQQHETAPMPSLGNHHRAH